MKLSLSQGSLQSVKAGQTIADGISVKSPGKLTYDIARKYLDYVVLVDDAFNSKNNVFANGKSKTGGRTIWGSVA